MQRKLKPDTEELRKEVGRGFRNGPSGKLVQIEHALTAVGSGQTYLGIKAANGVVIATEKKLPSILVDETSVQKIQCLTPNTGVVYSGLRPFGVSLLVARYDDNGPQLYQDVKAIGLTQGDATMESSPVSQTTDLRPTFSDNVPNLGNGGNVPAMNVNNKLPTV
ncbi:hypothetical protein GOBAR_DD19716 [Gossypium barbadense]|nr:hypothetical protein GOBAR_DD19716 [Gossypium barbadense]